MSWAILAEVVKAVGELYGHLDEFDKHTKAAENAAAGKKPYPASDKVEAQLKKLDKLSKELEQLAKKRFGDPAGLVNVNMFDVDKPEKRKAIREALQNNMKVLLAASQEAEPQVEKLRKLEKDAKTRAAAAADVSKTFEKLTKAKIPPVVQTTAWEASQAFEAARCSLVGVENAAGAAADTVDKVRKDTFAELQSLQKFYFDNKLDQDEQ